MQVYIYNIHAICCNMMLLQCLWTFKIAHSSIWLSCRCFCHFLATVFCCDKDWRLLSCLWPWSCGRNCRPCKPANSSFLARRRIPRTSCFGFFVFFVFSSLVFRHLWGRHVLQASLFLRNLGRASVGLVGDLGCAFFHLSLLLQSLLLDLLVFISFFILHFVFFSHSITFCCIFPTFSHIFFYLFILFPSVSSPEVLGPSGLLEAWGNGYWGYKLRQTRKKSTKPMRCMMRMMRMVFFLICEICEANDPTFKPNMLKATQRFSGFVWM